jgi:hypothetical protein
MTLVHLFGLIFVLVFLILITVYASGDRKIPIENFRVINAFNRLKQALGLAVETGNRLHLSLGRGKIIGPQSSIGFESFEYAVADQQYHLHNR